jgi:hypothetical protein
MSPATRGAHSLAVALLATLIFSLLTAAPSQGAPVVVLEPSFAEGSSSGGPATLTAEARFLGTEYFGSPEPLTQATLWFPPGTVLKNEGFPICEQATLEQFGPVGCPAGSAAGQPGSFAAFVSFGGERIEEEGSVEAFFGPNGGISLFLSGRMPVALEMIAPGSYEPPAAPFGPGLKFQFPFIQAVPGAPYLSFKRLTIRLGSFGEEGLASVAAPPMCLAGGQPWRMDSTFEDGTGTNRASVKTYAQTCPTGPSPEQLEREAERQAGETGAREAGEKAAREAGERTTREAAERLARELANKRVEAEERTRDIAALKHALVPIGRAARLQRLLKLGKYQFVFPAPSPGTLVVRWYELSGGAHAATTGRPTLVALGRTSVATAGAAKASVELTTDGKRLLRHRRRAKLIAKSVFTPSGAAALSAEVTFVLDR